MMLRGPKGAALDPGRVKTLDQPAFNRDRLKAEKLIDSKVLEQLIRVQVDAGCSRPGAGVCARRRKIYSKAAILYDVRRQTAVSRLLTSAALPIGKRWAPSLLRFRMPRVAL